MAVDREPLGGVPDPGDEQGLPPGRKDESDPPFGTGGPYSGRVDEDPSFGEGAGVTADGEDQRPGGWDLRAQRRSEEQNEEHQSLQHAAKVMGPRRPSP